MEAPTREEKERSKKQKKSLVAQLERMDIYSKFKIVCELQDIKIREGLREAIKSYLKKYKELLS